MSHYFKFFKNITLRYCIVFSVKNGLAVVKFKSSRGGSYFYFIIDFQNNQNETIFDTKNTKAAHMAQRSVDSASFENNSWPSKKLHCRYSFVTRVLLGYIVRTISNETFNFFPYIQPYFRCSEFKKNKKNMSNFWKNSMWNSIKESRRNFPCKKFSRREIPTKVCEGITRPISGIISKRIREAILVGNLARLSEGITGSMSWRCFAGIPEIFSEFIYLNNRWKNN